MHLPVPNVARRDFIQDDAPERILVVVFLRGGCDGLTLVPPVADDAYQAARPLLAVRRKDVIDLDGYFGLNRELAPLMPHIESGELIIVHGAGSEDDTRSHFEAQDTMEHGGVDVGSGWLARYLRARGPSSAALSAVAIGTTRPESLRGAPAGAVMQSLRDFTLGESGPGFLDDLERLYASEQGGLGQAGRETIAAVRRLRAIRAQNDPPAAGAVYPTTNFGRGLREIARLIKADVGLVASTIDLEGWDTHFVQSQLIGGLMQQLAGGIDAFLRDLESERSRVDVIVMTEFGRRLRENSSFGTDHGAGSIALLIGAGATASASGPVMSGWTDLSPGSLDAVGDVPAAIDYRDLLGPVLTAHRPGLDLARVFPVRT